MNILRRHAVGGRPEDQNLDRPPGCPPTIALIARPNPMGGVMWLNRRSFIRPHGAPVLPVKMATGNVKSVDAKGHPGRRHGVCVC